MTLGCTKTPLDMAGACALLVCFSLSVPLLHAGQDRAAAVSYTEAQADTRWNILTPGGDIVKESAGALPTHILAAGRYTVLARYRGKDYSQEFRINTGEVKQIEVVIR